MGRDHSRRAAGDAGLIVVADCIDPSAEAAGLHLASHRRLWEAAGTLLASRCDSYHDDHAADVLTAAAKQAKITLTSEEVRAGLVERIRGRLVPAVIRAAFLEFLQINIGVFDLFGAGWESDPQFAKQHRGPWPAPRDIKETLSRYQTMIVLDPALGPFEPLLDGLAAGLRCFHRCTGDILPPLNELDLSKNNFASRADLLKLLKTSDGPNDRALQNARTMNERHTWAHRLRSIAQFCHVD